MTTTIYAILVVALCLVSAIVAETFGNVKPRLKP